MAEEKTIIARRGVASARGTQRLKFSHTDANKMNGLFEAHLDSVDVSMIKIGEEKTGMPSFNGLEIPKLRFTFASNEAIVSKRKYIMLSFNAVESIASTIPGGKDAWKVEQVFNWINHIFNVFICKGKTMEEVFTEEQINSLNLPFVDFDENGEYVPVEPETVIAGWKQLFDNVVYIMNNFVNDKPCYQKEGKPIPVWIKLLRCIKTKDGWKNVNNGDLSFPTFIGEGCIELFVPNSNPSIRLDVVKESILPRVADKPKQPTQLNVPPMGGTMMGGMMDGAMPSAQTDFGAGSPFYDGEDMPMA